MAEGWLHKLGPYHSIERYVNGIFRKNGLNNFLLNSDKYTIDFWDSQKKDLPVLLLLPAFAADTKYSWFRQVSALSKHYRLIIPNLLFFGRSTMKEKSFGVHDQVQAIDTLIQHLSLSAISIVSASYGSIVAAEFAHLRSIPINQLVMTNAPFILDGGSANEQAAQKFGIIRRSELLVPENAAELKRLFNLTYYRKPILPKFIFNDLFRNLYAGRTEDKKKLIDTCVHDLEMLKSRVYDFEFPVLLLWGTHDILVSIDTATELQKRLGNNARLQLVSRTAHMPNFEKPRIYNHYLLDFLLNEK